MSKMSEEELKELLDKYLAPAWLQTAHTTTDVPSYGLHLHEAVKAIHSYTQEKCREVELHYLEKLLTVYDDINTGVAKKQSNSTFYINKAIHTEGEIKHLKAQLNKSKGE